MFNKIRQKVAKFIANHPYVMVLGVLVFLIVIIAIDIVKTFKVDATDKNFVVRSGDIASNIDATYMSYKTTFFDPEKNYNEHQPHQQNTQNEFKILLLYECSGCDNLLTEKYLKKLYNYEKEIFGNSKYNQYCLKEENDTECSAPWSVITYFFPNGTLVDDIEATTLEILNNSVDSDFLCDKNFNSGNLKSKYLRSTYDFGLPLAGYENRKDRYDSQEEKFNDWIVGIVPDATKDHKTDSFQIFYLGDGVTDAYVNYLILRDGSLIFASIIMVFIYTWFHTKSLFLAAMGIFHIIMAFPLSYFVYRVIIGEKYFSMLNFLSLFIVLGIGCDDIFIMLDAWKQSLNQRGIGKDKQSRLEWSYSRASLAMLITTTTSAFAFFGNLFSSIPAIKFFGIFTGFAIVFNYLLVITWFPAIIIIWYKFGEGQCCCKTKKKKAKIQKEREERIARGEIELEEFQTKVSTQKSKDEKLRKLEESKKSNNPKNSKEIKKELESDYDYPIEDLEKNRKKKKKDKNEEKDSISESESYENDNNGKAIEEANLEEKHVEIKIDTESPEKKILFYKKYAPFINKAKVYLIIIFLILFGLGIYGTTKLEPATDPAQFLKDDDPLQRAANIQEEDFPTASVSTSFQIVWGIDSIDREGVDPMEIEDLGKVIYDTTWDPTTPTAQLYVIDVCQQFRALPDVKDGKIFCFMEDFRDFIEDLSPGVYSGFPVNSSVFYSALLNFTRTKGDDSIETDLFELQSFYEASIRFDQDTSELRYFGIIANSTLYLSSPASDIRPVYDNIKAFMDKINSEAPNGMNKGFTTSDLWLDMKTEEILVSVALFNIYISLSIAFVVIVLSTGNVLTSFFAIFSIAGIVLTIIGFMVAIGWQLGIIESVSLTIIVGISVDYVVHFGHAYTVSQASTRFFRLRFAITDLGISVFSAAITTLLSALMLFFTQILFFRNFGIFLWIVIFLSMIWSFVFFFSTLAWKGPVTPKTDLKYILSKIFGCCRRNKKKKENENENENNEETQKDQEDPKDPNWEIPQQDQQEIRIEDRTDDEDHHDEI
ncbi:sterol-sensing domain [Anaeramoeba ignava]|uniref:Sterol-sensing domain n=1 Tax=Anaeramoeba ignava TaxID=1746090 RepID=A0A9Q0R409_ANAIG|nr:sterol-sensing domain [Anaeramoeba ignava]